jgi:hypothetical protein
LPAKKANFSGEMLSELTALIDNTIRVLDLVMITRADDRSVEATEMRDAGHSEIGESPARAGPRDPARRGGRHGDRREAAQSQLRPNRIGRSEPSGSVERAAAAIGLRRDERTVLPTRDGRVALGARSSGIRFSLSAAIRLNATGVLSCIPAGALETSTSLRDRR